MFLQTLCVGETFVRNVLKKCDTQTGIVKDRKKTDQGGRKLSDDMKTLIKERIKSFPIMESHYTREQSSRTFLVSNLNLTKMNELFLEKYTSTENLPKKCSYNKVFMKNVNLGFHKPKKDQCSTCITFKHMTPEQQPKAKAAQSEHLVSKDLARGMKETNKIEGDRNATRFLQVYTFDLQKVLHTPFGENGLLYYYRKLAVYNFTSFDLIQMQGYCFIWNETIAKTGASEISSCLLKLIEFHCTTDNMKLVLFADNCPEQSKYRFIIQMISLAVRKFKNIRSIQLVFLEREHMQNENDLIHSTIEKSK